MGVDKITKFLNLLVFFYRAHNFRDTNFKLNEYGSKFWTIEDGYKNHSISYPIFEYGGEFGKMRVFVLKTFEMHMDASCSSFLGFKVNKNDDALLNGNFYHCVLFN